MASVTGEPLDAPERVLDVDLSELDVVRIAGGGVGGATFDPGWTRADDEKPIVDGGAERRPFWRPDGGP
jgi:hypothetical protein